MKIKFDFKKNYFRTALVFFLFGLLIATLTSGLGYLILSRNLEPVLRAYGDYLGIREVIPDAYDRSTALDDFLSKNPQHKRLIIRVDGDNGEKELVRYAMNLVQEGRLDNVISILRTTTPDHLTSNEHPEFTVRVGTNDFGLIHLISKAER